MSVIHLALSNLRRRKLRTLVTGSGVALAVALAFCLLSFYRGYQRGLQTELDRLGAHLLLVPKGCPYDAASVALHGASWPCYLKEEYVQAVERTQHVAHVAPVLMMAVYDTGQKQQTVYCGITNQMRKLRPGWQVQGTFPQNAGDLLVGYEAAKTRGWKVGQTVRINPGSSAPFPTAPQTWRVSGILEQTGGPDDLFLFPRLSDAQALWGKPKELTHVLVRLDNPDNMEQAVRDLRGCDAGMEMTVVPLAHLFQTIRDLAQGTRLLLGCVALTALIGAGAGVGNTVFMAVAERAQEIGVLRAIGWSRGQVFTLVWLETALLTLASGIAGVVLATVICPAFEAYLRSRLPYAPSDALLRPEVSVGSLCLLLSLFVGTLAAFVPARRAAQLFPVQAMGRATGGAGI
jgi:putative ABC transport system permease protein